MDYQLLEFLLSFVSKNKTEKFSEIIADRTNHITLILEDIYNPQNASAVVRTADCFGIQNVHVIEKKYEFYVSKQVMSGSEKWVNISKHNNILTAISDLKSNGYKILATTPSPTGIPISKVNITQKTALLFGNEREGVSEEAFEQADERVYIPMFGFTESFNLSVSAAIILNHLVTKLRENSNINWQLSETERFDTYMFWLKSTLSGYDQLVDRFYSKTS